MQTEEVTVWAKGDLTSVRAHYAVSPLAPVVKTRAFNMCWDDLVKIIAKTYERAEREAKGMSLIAQIM